MKNVTIFTSKTCPYCHTAKEFLKEKGIPFEEKNISLDASAREELIRRGSRGVPTFLIGEDMVVGFDTKKIESLLDFVIIPCPECKVNVRLPKNKGKVIVTCPKCSNEFKTAT